MKNPLLMPPLSWLLTVIVTVLGCVFVAFLVLGWFCFIMPLTLVERAWKDSMR